MNLSITGGKALLPVASEPQDIAVHIAEGRIVDAVSAKAETLDAKGLIVAPGIVDLGVFATDKPAFHFGGVTRAALMPDRTPPLDDPGAVRAATRSGKPDFWVHPLAAATKNLAGTELAEYALMREAGARGVATGRRWIADSGVMLRVMSYAAALDLPVFVHSEDGGLTDNAVATAGETATGSACRKPPPPPKRWRSRAI